jgi:trk system potassium uptake protein TrkH
MNLTPELTTAGKLIVTAAMFAGRVGPLVLASALLERENRGQRP